MPGSVGIFDGAVTEFLREHGGAVLDIGPGCGKIGALAKKVGCSPVSCIEVFEPYIFEHKLHDLYDEVETADVIELLQRPDETYNIVIFGDVIEHLPKSAGRDLLEYFVIRSEWILVIFPINTDKSCLYQGSVDGNRHEGHISIWSEQDFIGLEAKVTRNGPMCIAVIRGYGSKNRKTHQKIQYWRTTGDDT